MHAQFLFETPLDGKIHRLVAPGMRTTTVGPVIRPESFVAGTPLDQQLASVIEYEQREGAMQNTVSIMTAGFVPITHNVVSGIHQNQRFAFR
jgi:hypothetical protein